MANQSLVPFLLKPLYNRWMDPNIGSALSAATCRWHLDLTERTLRCDCLLLISCVTSDGDRLDVADCDGSICVSLQNRTFVQSVSRPRPLVAPDGSRLTRRP